MDKIVLCLHYSVAVCWRYSHHTYSTPRSAAAQIVQRAQLEIPPDTTVLSADYTLKQQFGITHAQLCLTTWLFLLRYSIKEPCALAVWPLHSQWSTLRSRGWQLHMRSWEVHLKTWFCFLHYSTNASLGAGSVATTLTVDHALKQHSGNYTCAVGSLASATVAVHILNGKTG
jgi:hypothetical protein